jgi:hypothetical protein
MGKLGKLVGAMLGDNVVRVLLVVVLSLTAYNLSTEVFGKKYQDSYEMAKDLPAYSLTENITQRESQTLPSVIRLHTGKATDMQRLKAKLTFSEPPEENEFFCTAFVVSDKYAITAGHCLDGEDGIEKSDINIFIEYQDQGMVAPSYKDSEVKARAVGINRRGDTGLLIGDFSSFRKVKFSPYSNDILEILKIAMSNGGQLIAVGFPYGDAPFVTPVMFQGTAGFQLRGQALLYPGMSGGPLIEPTTGYAIGVNSSVSYDGGSNFSSLVGLLESLGVPVTE